MISRPSAATRYCTIHRHASLLFDSNISTVAIHSSVSTLAGKHTQTLITQNNVFLRLVMKCYEAAGAYIFST